MTRTQIINALIKKNNYKNYLEIGVNNPAYNWIGINAELKHGVDPNVDTTYRMTSDEFFENHISQKYDIVFVDGLHLFEQVYKDITNSLDNLNEGGTIVVHDCNPITEITQKRVWKPGTWTWHGDVWKSILKLRLENTNLEIDTVDTDEGCGIIRKGKQELLKLEQTYADVYQYDVFDSNREKILNLISVEEFTKKYL